MRTSRLVKPVEGLKCRWFFKRKENWFFFFWRSVLLAWDYCEDWWTLHGEVVSEIGRMLSERNCLNQRERSQELFLGIILWFFNPMSSFKNHFNYCSLVCFFYLFAFNCQVYPWQTHTNLQFCCVPVRSVTCWMNKHKLSFYSSPSKRLIQAWKLPLLFLSQQHQESLNRDCVLFAG